MDDEKTTQQHLAETVILLRMLRGLTQAELAARSGLSDVYVRQIERAERDISIGSLEKLSSGLSCDPGELLRSDGRSAIQALIGQAYSIASEEDRRAIVFVLRSGQGERTPREKALLRLLADEIESLMPQASVPRPGRAGQPQPRKSSAKRARRR